MSSSIRRSLTASGPALFVFLVAASTARAQISEGNSDKDGTSFPSFPVPGGSVLILNGGEGAADIPLSVPPGVGGMAPRLALRYSSGAPDDGLGVGWSLALGYPDAIRRTTRFGVPTYRDDAFTPDVFTFDGQDLVPSTIRPGYRTRIDSFRKIQRAGGGWVVTQKDGTALYYGSSADRCSSIPGKGTYAWHLSEVIDTFGKTIYFDYEGPEEARRLKRIRYTHKAAVAIGQQQKVLLHWQFRPDPTRVRRASSYGADIVRDQWLDRIETFSSAFGDEIPLRTYDLCYADEACSPVPLPLKGTPLLTAVTETGADGTALPAWKFRYQERQPGWGPDTASAGFKMPAGFTWHFAESPHPNDFRAWDTGARLTDLNGDSLPDLIHSNHVVQEVFLNDGRTGWSLAPAGTWALPLEQQNPYWFILPDWTGTGVVDMGVRVLDVNGDGLPDLLKSNDYVQEVRLNNGSGWNSPGQYLFPPAPPGAFWASFNFAFFGGMGGGITYSTDMGVRLADVNGDGLPDLLMGREKRNLNEVERLVYLNNGRDGWDPAPPEWSLPYNFVKLVSAIPAQWADAGVQLVDINADGLVDVVKAVLSSTEDKREVWLNTGAGWSLSNWEFPVYFLERRFDPSLGRHVFLDNGVQVVDVDGDRHPDLLKREPGDAPSEVYLNDQSGGFVQVPWDIPVGLVAWVGRYNGGGGLQSWHVVDNGVRIVDVDGDGFNDVLVGRQEASTIVGETYLGRPGIVDLLVEHTNPLGGRASIDYSATSGLGLTPGRMPFTRTVATSLTRDAGLGDSALQSRYEYQQGLFDWQRRDFRGFARVIETRADDTKAERSFFLDEGRKGLQSGEGLRDSDGKFYSAHPRTFTTSQDAEGVHKTLLTNELIVQFHENDQTKWVRRSIDYTHDAYGNVKTVRESDWGRIERVCGPLDPRAVEATPAVRPSQQSEVPKPDPCRDEFMPGAVLRSSRTTYTEPDTERWTVGIACAVERFDGDLLTAGNTARSTEELYYEDKDTRCAAVAQNRLTKKVLIDHKLEGLNLGSGGASVTTKYGHDEYGNVTTETNGRGYDTTFDYAGNGQLFPHRTCRGTLCWTTLYDRGYGVLASETDPNDQTTQYGYDGLGRLKTRSQPYDGDGDPGLRVDYVIGGLPAHMKVTERLDATRTRYRFEYFDGLGRAKAKIVGVPSDWRVSGLTRYDQRGRADQVYVPFPCQSAESDPALASCPPGTAASTTYTYEDDKLSVTGLPGGGSTSNLHLADAVQHTDESSIPTLRTYDGLGRLRAVTTDVGGSGTTHKTTRYSYDGLGGLTRSVDPVAEGGRGVETLYFYDAWGRLRGLSAPESTETPRNGFRIWNDYDEQGNQTHRWSGAIVWNAEYDHLDRQTAFYYSPDGDPAHNREGKTFRAYDLSTLGKGRLSYMVDYGVGTSANIYNYDRRGRVTQETLYNAFPNLPTVTATIGYEYDLEDKVTGIKDPRDRWIRYTRNAFGQIDRSGDPYAIRYNEDPVKGIADFVYDAAGQTKTVEYGNGLNDVYFYDPRGRMTDILGSSPLRLNYHYEGGHLMNETSTDGSTDVDYRYDHLGRLKGAEGFIGSRAVAFSYGYDASGNLETVAGEGATTVTSRYTAGTNRLEAVRYGGGPELSALHDPRGNLKQLVGKRTHTFDGLDHLIKVEGASGSVSMAYDGRGRKIGRSIPGGSELYFHTLDGRVLASYRFLGNQRSWTTYIYGEGKRLASVDAQDRMAYIHSDRLGSARALTADTPGPCLDGQGQPAPCRLDYLPFGEEVRASTGADDFRFTGKERENELYDFGARFYDPVLGRFLQIDGFFGRPHDPRTLNRYSYALDAPTAYVDPTGNYSAAVDCCPFWMWSLWSWILPKEEPEPTKVYELPAIEVLGQRDPIPLKLRLALISGVNNYFEKLDRQNQNWHLDFVKETRQIAEARLSVMNPSRALLSEEWVAAQELARLEESLYARYEKDVAEDFRVYGLGMLAAKTFLDFHGPKAPGPALNVPSNANRKGPNWGQTDPWYKFEPFNPKDE